MMVVVETQRFLIPLDAARSILSVVIFAFIIQIFAPVSK
jgi:hypothetical protein